MENEQSICPVCGSKLVEKVIDYSDWNNSRLLVIREVPVRECEANGHRFFQAKFARSLERLFGAEKQEQLKPVAVMEVPVFRLEMA